jgi:hypothetical protein
VTFASPGTHVIHAQSRGADGVMSAPVEFGLSVQPNRAPVPLDVQRVSLTEDLEGDQDGANAIQLGATQPPDEAAEQVTLKVTDPPKHGTLTGIASDGTGTVTNPQARVTYVPAANYDSSDSFEYIACDGFARPGDSDGCSAPQLVEIGVAPVNDPPVASPASATGDEDSPGIPVALTATDVENDPLSHELNGAGGDGTVTTAKGGKVTIDGSTATYVPAADFNGEDSFEFRANDGRAVSEPQTAAITVVSVPDTPAAGEVTADLNEDAPLTLTLAGADADGDAIDYSVVRAPEHGKLGAIAPSGDVSYAPDRDYAGSDTFRYRVSKHTDPASFAEAEVTLHVAPVEDPPTAAALALSTAEDTPRTLTLAGGDVDLDDSGHLSYAIVDGPAHGSLGPIGPDGSARYTPGKDFNGPDSFRYRVTDTHGESAEAEVDVDVAAVEDAPTASDTTVGASEDTPRMLMLTGADTDADDASRLSYAIIRAPRHGSLGPLGGDGSVTYTPDRDYAGSDSFRYRVTDTHGQGSEAEVALDVAPVNDAPTAQDGTLVLEQGRGGTLRLRAADVDGDTLAYSVSKSPVHGKVELTGDSATYTPDPGFSGADGFTFRATDPAGASSQAKVSITIAARGGEPTNGGGSEPQQVTVTRSPNPPAEPPPAAGSTFQEVRGTIAVAVPGGGSRAPEPGDPLPHGTLIDATRGTIVIAISRPDGKAETVAASGGAFTLGQRIEGDQLVTELRLAAPASAAPLGRAQAAGRVADRARLLVDGRCRCRVISRDARIDSKGPAKWLTVQDRAATSVRLVRGQVRVSVIGRRCGSVALPLAQTDRSTGRGSRKLKIPRTGSHRVCPVRMADRNGSMRQ